MARWLAEHPAVYLSSVKEPHYYSTDLRNRNVASECAYRRLFRAARPQHLAVGEASTWYLYSQAAVPAILSAHPDARFVVMTRDPVDMALSLHHHNRRVLHEDEPDFERAWRLQEDRAAGRSLPSTCTEPVFLQYRDVCSLGTQLNRLYAQVPHGRVLHILLDDIKRDPGQSYRQVLDFLGVPDDGRAHFPVANKARGHRSRAAQRVIRWSWRLRSAVGIRRGFGLARLNESTLPKQSIRESFRLQLQETFANETRVLGEQKYESI